MATQSLYRRYRPRRFSEIRGQDHVVRALRNAVIHQREGQGYLFSGPRGTGKTTSARVLAKVLNCTNPVEGEPCCVCDSCLAVEAGTSYDVHELDAASNNGVEAMRDLIEKASLGTPGRHKVYILDEVHMLSKGAEAALLKTLEEPPPHVVFVLATTDPQKVSQTIRSRVQHLEFHLLPMDELEEHVRWVIADAGLVVSEEGLQSALAQGGGSARDTLSALELVAASGGEAPLSVSYDEFIESLINHDPGQALSALAHAVHQGRDPRVLAQDIIRTLRDCFLSLMAPELVQLPDVQAAHVAEQAQRLGAAAIVRSMERLGEMLVEMRHAPDPRLLLDVALVQLTHEPTGNDLGAIVARLERLEKSGVAAGAPGAAAAPSARPAPVDPSTGRAALGGRAKRDESPVAATAPVGSSAERPAASPPATATQTPAATPAPAPAPPSAPAAAVALVPQVVPPAAAPSPSSAPAAPSSGTGLLAAVTQAWQPNVLPTLKPMARALFSAGHFVSEAGGTVSFGLPNDTHRSRCESYRGDVEAAITAQIGSAVKLSLVVDTSGPPDDHLANVVPLRKGAQTSSAAVAAAETRARAEENEIDLSDLVDAPPEAMKSPADRLVEAFPGSVFVEDPR
ncbi:MAG: dnaX [Acidimicrobiales bacterium]|nr:dnaX [Acidimicrobiales bacterium]